MSTPCASPGRGLRVGSSCGWCSTCWPFRSLEQRRAMPSQFHHGRALHAHGMAGCHCAWGIGSCLSWKIRIKGRVQQAQPTLQCVAEAGAAPHLSGQRCTTRAPPGSRGRCRSTRWASRARPGLHIVTECGCSYPRHNPSGTQRACTRACARRRCSHARYHAAPVLHYVTMRMIRRPDRPGSVL